MAVAVRKRLVIKNNGDVAAQALTATSMASTGAVSGTAGTFTGALVVGTTTVHTPHVVSALALSVTASTVFTKSVSADSTFTASAAGTAGQLIILIISVDATQRVITCGTNLNSSGTLTIPASKVGTLTFVSDGVAFREIARAILT
jgi:hypothetical protein